MRVHRDDVFVELPGMNQGVIPLKNFVETPATGDVLDVIVARFNADDRIENGASRIRQSSYSGMTP